MGVKNQQGRGLKDANHDELVADYRATGCSVFETNGVGFGFPDLVIGCSGRTELVELKSDEGDLNPGQRAFVRDWRGSKVRIVRTRDDVLDHVRWIRARVIHEAARPVGT